MVKYLFIFFVLVFIPDTPLTATGSDSLLRELIHVKNDTSKIKILLALHSATKNNNDSALKFANEAITIAEKNNDDKWIFDATNTLAKFYYSILNYDSCLLIEQRLLSLKKNTSYLLGLGRSYRTIGNAFLHSSLDSAMFYYIKSLYLFKSINDLEEYNATQTNMAIVYSKTGRLKEAVQICEFQIEYYHKTGSRQKEEITAMNCAIYCESLGDWKSAEHYLLNSFQIAKELKNEFDISFLSYNLGGLYAQTKRFKQAKQSLLFSLEIGKKINNNELIYNAYGGLANLANTTGDWDDAINYASRAWELGPKNKESEADVNMQMYNGYLHKGDHKKALEYYTIYIAARDSLLNTQRLQKIDELEAQYQNKDKQSQIEVLNIANENHKQQKKLTYVIGSMALLLLVVGFYSAAQRQIFKSKIEKQHALIEERKRISRDLHDDVGSGLTKISLMSRVAEKMEGGRQKQTLQKISNDSSEMVDSMNGIIWALNTKDDSLSNLVAYIRQQAFTLFEDAPMSIILNTPEQVADIPMSGVFRRNIYLAVKEALNNALKYSQATEVNLKIEIIRDMLIIIIGDNGNGFDVENAIAGKKIIGGNGLANMKKRMDEINGELKIESEINKGTMVTFNFRFGNYTKV
ncbi:MAG: ATP-binding protein [Bacteroidota bacterium]